MWSTDLLLVGGLVLVSVALGAGMFALAVGVVLHAVKAGILTGPETYTVVTGTGSAESGAADQRLAKPFPFVIKDDAKEAEIEKVALGHKSPEYFDNLESLGR